MNLVIFHALRPDGDEAVVAEHQVEESLLCAYTDRPSLTLAAIRVVEKGSRVKGFRVEDPDGRLLLRYEEVDEDPGRWSCRPPSDRSSCSNATSTRART